MLLFLDTCVKEKHLHSLQNISLRSGPNTTICVKICYSDAHKNRIFVGGLLKWLNLWPYDVILGVALVGFDLSNFAQCMNWHKQLNYNTVNNLSNPFHDCKIFLQAGPIKFPSECRTHFHRIYHNTRDCSRPTRTSPIRFILNAFLVIYIYTLYVCVANVMMYWYVLMYW